MISFKSFRRLKNNRTHHHLLCVHQHMAMIKKAWPLKHFCFVIGKIFRIFNSWIIFNFSPSNPQNYDMKSLDFASIFPSLFILWDLICSLFANILKLIQRTVFREVDRRIALFIDQFHDIFSRNSINELIFKIIVIKLIRKGNNLIIGNIFQQRAELSIIFYLKN